MITDFRQFGIEHIVSILAACLIGGAFIAAALRNTEEAYRIRLRRLFALTIILVRGSRYIMDVIYGRFDIFDLFSLQICHIDLILLVICLLKPRPGLFNFIFLIGIPTALAVALMPGTIHPAPGLARAVLFIMSHVMLVMGALYLLIAEGMKPAWKYYIRFSLTGGAGVIAIYFINKMLETNFLYIMEAPEGTAIKALDKLFGWPGYVLVMLALMLSLMLIMFLIHNAVVWGLGLAGRNERKVFINE